MQAHDAHFGSESQNIGFQRGLEIPVYKLADAFLDRRRGLVTENPTGPVDIGVGNLHVARLTRAKAPNCLFAHGSFQL